MLRPATPSGPSLRQAVKADLTRLIAENPKAAYRALKMRELELSQLAFTRHFFQLREGAGFKTGLHHACVADALDKVMAGEISRLIINIPPGYTKTQMAVIDFVARGLAINPKARFIHASYSGDLVNENSVQIRDTISSADYQSLWDVRLRPDAKAKGLWKTMQGGGILAKPAGGPITGFRAGRMEPGFTGALIIDDPIKPDDALSLTKRQAINDRWHSTFRSRLAREDIPVIVIMQRLHVDDFSGMLLAGGSGEQWHHLILPIEIDPASPYPDAFSHGIALPHALPAGPLWPARHGPGDIDKLKADRFTFAGQYMQQPVIEGGAMIRAEWLGPYTDPPDLSYRKIFADTAQKAGERHDYSVFQCWGKARFGPNIYLIDQVRGRWEEPELIQVAKTFWDKHANSPEPIVKVGPVRSFAIEDKVSGTALIQHLKRAGAPVEPVSRGRDKITRCRDVTAHMACGYVHVPKFKRWYTDYEAELLAFPEGAFDDQVDPTLDAVMDMCGGGLSLTDLY